MTAATSFWARRRAAVEAEEAAEQAALSAEAEARAQAELAEKTDAEILAALELPDPETLAAGDDFSAFMAKAVPQHIRNRALRKLWRSNPVLACLDGLNDYDDDYLTGSFGVGPVQTTYQVGKGMLAHLLETAKPAAEASETLADAEAEPAVTAVEEARATETAAEAEPQRAQETEAEPVAVLPRRMQIRFEGDSA